MNLKSPLTDVDGIGRERAKKLDKLGIRTVGDLVHYYPRSYEMRGDVRLLKNGIPGEVASYILTVKTTVSTAQIKRGFTISKFRALDESGTCEIVFFNSPYVKDCFCIGNTFRFYGKLEVGKGGIRLSNPKYDQVFENRVLPDFVPIYPLTEGITSKQLSKWIASAVNETLPRITDPLSDDLCMKNELCSLSYAIRGIHFPDSKEMLDTAMRRLAFDELFSFGLGIAKCATDNRKGNAPFMKSTDLKPFLNLLPFELTSAQKNTVNEIWRDMTKKEPDGHTPPMTRILVGDVGSGKTVCAEISIFLAVKNGYQTALMAPTEILVRQHYKDLSEKFGALGIEVGLLVGSTSAKEKNRIYSALADGSLKVIVGTHALLSEKTEFRNLGLIVTDEQHRFGVKQRAILKNKSDSAHLLVMSATPIPRTLALSLYGDLDVSKISEMPKGRIKVDTYAVDETYRKRLNAFIRKQVEEGGQVYIVTPAIESDEETGFGVIPDPESGTMVHENFARMKNAVDYAKDLQKDLPDLPIEVLHGKMKAAEKDEIMGRFVSGETKILVSTTVIEVGVNVPNATLMIVENADRFGLSQLHQLRGRVGRGKKKSYCILVSDEKSEKARKRLEIMTSTSDGFEIAEKDLMMRGPGDFFSSISDDNIRQSGGFSFRFASVLSDADLMNSAFSEAKAVLADDPELSKSEHASYLSMIENLFLPSADTIS